MRKKITLFIFATLLIVSLTGCQAKVASKVPSLMKSGKIALKEGSYDAAIEAFKEGLEEEPDNKEALELLIQAQQEKRLESINITPPISILNNRESTSKLDFDIDKTDQKFYLNGLSLLMTRDEIISLWGEPDAIDKPDPNDEYYEDDFENWLYLTYGELTLTLYSDLLRVVELRTADFIFDNLWYRTLGKPDEIVDNHRTFYTDEHYISFSEVEPYMQWGERFPEPSKEEVSTETATISSNITEYHLSTQSPTVFFERMSQLTGYNIQLDHFEPLYDIEAPTQIIGYVNALTEMIDISYNGNDQLEVVDISQYGGNEPSPEFLTLLKGLITSASSIDPDQVVTMLDDNFTEAENGLFISSIVYHDGLVYKF